MLASSRAPQRAPQVRLQVAAALVGLAGTFGCGPEPSLRVHCDEVLLPAQSQFSEVAKLVVSPGPKSCAACHNTRSPVYGLNFEAPGVAWDSLTTRMELIYPQLASGAMPKDGVAWDESALLTLRSWYCGGGQYDGM